MTMGQKRIELMEREAKAAAQRIIKFEFPEVDDSEYQAIDNIPIQNLICAEFGWEYIDRHFRAPGTTKLKACFIGKDGNYVVHGSTDHFSDEHKGYNSFRFIRMMHRLDNAGTFRWFENEFPEIGELARQKRIEYKQKQAPALEGGVLLSILANDRQKLNKIIDQIPDDFDLSELPALLDEAFSLMARLNGAEAYSILKHKLKKRFGLTNDDIKRYEKVIAQRRKAYSAAIILDVQDKECNEALTEDETIKAEELLKSQTLLFDVLKAIKSLRVVGEEENILIIYLVLTSRLLAQPLSLEIKGDSSTGKSYPPNQIVKIFPPSAYKALTGMTAQSMYYSKPDEFKHRILLIFERHGSEKADYTIRSFQSEGRLELQTTIKDPLTGEFKAVTKSIEGPIGVIETTTSAMIHSENETRNLSIYTDQSKEQTIRILNNINAQYLPGSGVSFNTKPWRNIQQILNKYKVVISFGSSISKRLPPAFIETSRIRRDYSKLLGLIEVSAILHQKQRQIINVNGEEYLEATLADYYIAKIIAEGSFSKTIQEMPVQTTIILKKIEELQLEKLMESGEDVMPDDIAAKHLAYTFTVRVLAEKLGGDKSNIYKWLGPAIAKNYIIEEAEHKGSRGAIYRLNFNKKFLEQESFPEVEELLSDLPDNYECIDEIYNPITGDRVEIDKNKIKEHKNTQPKLKTPDNLVANKQDEPTKTNTNSNFNNRIIIDGPVSIDTGQNIGMNSPTPPWLNRSNKSHDDNYIGDKGEFDVDSIPF
ncbi:MAG: hypothetical protein NTW06_04670 [Candidatus Falkowbacteria bacterium]|nr:hypothetical protein [Candidatus Falkowbacteria bacterium]